nr:hypothetical protein [Paraburkholderia ferrariae]
MNFGLLLSNLPHIEESRSHYEAMLSLHAHEPHKFAALWRNLKRLIAFRTRGSSQSARIC